MNKPSNRTGLLFDAPGMKRDAVLTRFGEIGLPLDPKKGAGTETFGKNRKDVIVGALKEAIDYLVAAAAELIECGQYDTADEVADLYEKVGKARKEISAWPENSQE